MLACADCEAQPFHPEIVLLPCFFAHSPQAKLGTKVKGTVSEMPVRDLLVYCIHLIAAAGLTELCKQQPPLFQSYPTYQASPSPLTHTPTRYVQHTFFLLQVSLGIAAEVEAEQTVVRRIPFTMDARLLLNAIVRTCMHVHIKQCKQPPASLQKKPSAPSLMHLVAVSLHMSILWAGPATLC